MNIKKYNIVRDIYEKLFGYKNSYNLEKKYNCDVCIARDIAIDLTQTSRNLDFAIKTYQSKSENIYFTVYLYDYDQNKDIYCGDFYIKDNCGEIAMNHLEMLFHIIAAGNEITKQIFYMEV